MGLKMKRTLEVRTYQAIILKALMRRVKGGPHFLLLYQDDLLLQLYIAAMHTRIVSLYHEVVEFGISARDYRVSSFSMYREASRYTVGHLICALISKNQGLENLRSVSNLRKISGPAHLNFFSVDLNIFQFVNWIFFRFVP